MNVSAVAWTAPTPVTQPDGAPEHLLIVDDDAAYRYLCRAALESTAQCPESILEASSAAETLELLRAQPIDCILLDYVLPDGTGADLIREIRDIYPDWIGAIIVMTSGGSEKIAGEVLRAGAMDYIPKDRVSGDSLVRAIRNATHKARLEHDLLEKNAHLLESNNLLERRASEISNFYHKVSHEIKTPLTAIRMFVSILHEGLTGPLTDEQREILGQCLDSCDELVAQFNDLVDCTRLESKKVSLKKSRHDVRKLIQRATIAAGATAEAKSIRLSQKCEETLPDIHVDPGRFCQVLANLVGNGIKFTKPGGSVVLDAYVDPADDTYVVFEVSDNGIGIEEANLTRVFDRLFQVDTSSDASLGAGLGLGLTIAREIVRLHGGSLSVTSIVGAGTTFTVRIPVDDPGDDSIDDSEGMDP